MSKENLVTRREFTVETALAMLAGVTITIAWLRYTMTTRHSPLAAGH